jgi:alkylhydroperoxidase family enzyme
VARERGHVGEEDLKAVKAAGWADAQLVEFVQYVALNFWTNIFNEVFKTDIDFPVVTARQTV